MKFKKAYEWIMGGMIVIAIILSILFSLSRAVAAEQPVSSGYVEQNIPFVPLSSNLMIDSDWEVEIEIINIVRYLEPPDGKGAHICMKFDWALNGDINIMCFDVRDTGTNKLE